MKIFRICIPRVVRQKNGFVGMPEMLDTLRRSARRLVACHPNEYALIHQQEIVGVASFKDGVNEGYRRFGLEPFLVQSVQEVVKPVRVKTWRDLVSIVGDFFCGNLFVTFRPQL